MAFKTGMEEDAEEDTARMLNPTNVVEDVVEGKPSTSTIPSTMKEDEGEATVGEAHWKTTSPLYLVYRNAENLHFHMET